MADYQLTQTGNEVQDLLDNIPIGKFRLLSASNSTELDDIPSTNAEWICGIFDTLWANRPCDYGLCYRMTAPTQQWSYEIAHEAGNSPTIYYRASTNGYAWTSWTNVGRAKTSGVGFTLTDTTNFAVQSMVLYKMGNMRMLAMSLSTKTSLATGNYAIGTIDNASDRPQFAVSNFIARQDSGSQGIGTITVNSNGSVYYGVDIAGVSGVTIVTQVTWFTY